MKEGVSIPACFDLDGLEVGEFVSKDLLIEYAEPFDNIVFTWMKLSF